MQDQLQKVVAQSVKNFVNCLQLFFKSNLQKVVNAKINLKIFIKLNTDVL